MPSDRFHLVQTLEPANAFSEAAMIWMGLDGSASATALAYFMVAGHGHVAVIGRSAGINIAVVRAAIKARPPLKRPVQIFVFVGDTPPSDIGPPVDGITVHRVRADGSLWP